MNPMFCRDDAPDGCESPVTDAELDAFREVGDPLADAVVEQLVQVGERLAPSLKVVEGVADVHRGACRDFLAEVHRVPEWADLEFMRIAHERAIQNTLPSGIALLAGSLVESCGSAMGAKVLIRAGGLTEYAVRRVYETAQFVFDIADTGAAPGTKAHRRIVEVRLLHALVRRRMLARDDWEFGLPVNQEDYASTLLMFSHVYLRSMHLLGVPLTETEENAVHHAWRYCGWLMGIDEMLLSRDRNEERALYAQITRRQFQPDEDSRKLAVGLLDAMAYRRPFYLPAAALHQLSRRLISDPVADELTLRRSRTWDALLRTIPVSTLIQNEVAKRVPMGRRLGSWSGRRLCHWVLASTPVPSP